MHRRPGRDLHIIYKQMNIHTLTCAGGSRVLGWKHRFSTDCKTEDHSRERGRRGRRKKREAQRKRESSRRRKEMEDKKKMNWKKQKGG